MFSSAVIIITRQKWGEKYIRSQSMETVKFHIVAHEMMIEYYWGMSNVYVKAMK